MTESEQAETLVNASRQVRKNREEIAAIKIRLKSLGAGVSELGAWMVGQGDQLAADYEGRILESLKGTVPDLSRRIRTLETENRDLVKLLGEAGMTVNG